MHPDTTKRFPRGCRVIEFDLHNPGTIADPYPLYARLRDEAPVHYVADLDLWVLSRYSDVAAALRDPATFSSDRAALGQGLTVNPFNPTMKLPRPLTALVRCMPLRVLLMSDPPAHTVLRRKISKAFTPRMITEWEPRIRDIVERFIADLDTGDTNRPLDLMTTVASPLPTIVIAEMLGIPGSHHRAFKRWSDNLVDGLLGRGSIPRTLTSAVQISLYFARTIRKRRTHPGEDLISMLVRGEPEHALSSPELINLCVLLLVAGNETTTNLIANAVLALLAHPDIYEQLRADPTIADRVVEETLRYDNPAQAVLRVTTSKTTIDQFTIPGGSRVLMLIGSANRDPRHVADPDDFRLDREPNDHLGFGTGIHHCIGAPLARLEARVTLVAMCHHWESIVHAGQPQRLHSPILRGLRSLPITVDRSSHSRRA